MHHAIAASAFLGALLGLSVGVTHAQTAPASTVKKASVKPVVAKKPVLKKPVVAKAVSHRPHPINCFWPA